MNNHENNRLGSKVLPLILILIGLLLITGVLAWQAIQAGQAQANQGQSQTDESVESNTPFPEIKRVTLEEAKAAFDSKSAVFVDVRDAQSYAAAHIPEARNIPLAELENRTGELDPNQWIITYCTWPAEESSARAAEILQQKGFKHVNAILGGFHAWEEANYPVQK